MKQIHSFVLTGGPCGGKTSGLSIIEQELGNRGYYVLVVPETATELIPTGIRPFGNSLNNFDFQHVLLEKQLFKEKLYKDTANRYIPSNNIVILHDRGIIDNKTYMTPGEFQTLLYQFDMNEVSARDRYDAVFHLVTAANGAEEFYTLANNVSRTETPEQARELDRKGIANWTGHPHLRVIDNSTDFKKKMSRLMNEIYSSLGVPVPIEVERKYLVFRPDLDILSKYVDITTVDIVQSYLTSDNGKERRIRQRGQDGNFSYYITEKQETFGIERPEVERKISEKEYLCYLSQLDPSLKPIVKKRVCFVYKAQYFELDFFNFSTDYALMEIELTDKNSLVNLPSFINVLGEVTDDPRYRNHALAKTQAFPSC